MNALYSKSQVGYRSLFVCLKNDLNWIDRNYKKNYHLKKMKNKYLTFVMIWKALALLSFAKTLPHIYTILANRKVIHGHIFLYIILCLSLGKTFTLLCVDPDVPRATAGTQERPLLHWMVVNIPEGRVAEGDTVMTYRGPQPPDTAHYYYFLLYEQNNLINTTEAVNYTSPTNSR